jgi:hypothetical protein
MGNFIPIKIVLNDIDETRQNKEEESSISGKWNI